MIAEKKKRVSKSKLPPFRPTKIPEKTLAEFVGPVLNLFQIDAVHLFSNKFRINVWTKHSQDDKIIPLFKIHSSYFVSLTQDGTIINETRKS